ncbi:RNA polymerase sigma-70 factor [Halosquirtibacter xylanolyticus]|uniref:RNA polymerase sigma factor n=1 Tax=Halosquirtibacter xylanolyticus TaxID=3374599 RepID=UPI0037493425|nr:RNA polymerase sigma-70 factor [Prolixibacteraceae bacterium]
MNKQNDIDSITLGCLALGSEGALRKIIKRYNDDLMRYAFSLLKDREMAEEVVSEVFISFWSNRKRMKDIIHLKRYLVVSVRNKSLSELSKKRILTSSEENNEMYQLYSDHRSIEDDWISKEFYEFVMQKIDFLPQRCKEVLVMAKINGLKQYEIAEILSISPKTVENTLARALKKLHESVGI